MNLVHRVSVVLAVLVVLMRAAAALADAGVTDAAVAPAPKEARPEIVKGTRGSFPSYPPQLRKRAVSGFVLVQFRLEDDGRPRELIIVLAEPRGAFEKDALEAVRSLRFSVPPEWISSNPNRILEFAYMFQIEGCGSANAKAFPGIDVVIVSTRLPVDPAGKLRCSPPDDAPEGSSSR